MDWTGERPRICPNEGCAASKFYWPMVSDDSEFPRYHVDESSRESPTPYGWSNSPLVAGNDIFAPGQPEIWWYCQTCHETMHIPERLLRELREVGIKD